VAERVIWILFGSICIFIFLQQRQFHRNLLVVSIVGFLTGWRGLDITPTLIMYPTELFLWLGLLVYFMERTSWPGKVHSPVLKVPEIILALFAVLGGITALIYGQPVPVVLNAMKSFLVFIPMLVLFRSWIQDKDQIVFYARLLAFIGMIISILGLLERFVPQVAALFPTYMYKPTDIRFNFGVGSTIVLANFSSWGTPVVSTLLVLFTGLAVFLPVPKSGWQKIAWLFVLPVLILAIIATGYRSAWLSLIPIFILGIVLYPKRTVPYIASIMVVFLILFPYEYLDRFKTIFLMANSPDPTFIRRSLALQNGLQTLKNNLLLGTGWNTVEPINDLVNIGDSTGVFGLLVFLIWYIRLLVELLKYAWRIKVRDNYLLPISFFAALSGYAIAMFSGAMSDVLPIMTGFWFVFCLGWRLVEIFQEEELRSGKAVSVTPDIQ